jgi:hemerythrin-like metal-binding protein
MMLQRMEWSEAYSVAQPALDAEHRGIVDAIGEIADAADISDAARLRALLCASKEKVAAHFAHEDAILREIQAFTASARRNQKFLAAMTEALIEDHIGGHRNAAKILDDMIRDTLREKSCQVDPLAHRLTHWFVNHAVKHDARLKTLFQTMENDCPELFARLD